MLEGTATVAPQTGNRYPLYTILVRAEPLAPPECTANFGLPADFVRDGGRWFSRDPGLRFESQLGAGSYNVAVGDASGGPRLTATIGGHTLEFQRARAYGTAEGAVIVEVVDGAGSPVGRAVVAVSQQGLVVVRRVVGNDAVRATVARGPATVRVTPPPGFAAAPGHALSLEVTVPNAGAVAAVRVALARQP